MMKRNQKKAVDDSKDDERLDDRVWCSMCVGEKELIVCSINVGTLFVANAWGTGLINQLMVV